LPTINQKIQFFSEDISFRISGKLKLRAWLYDAIREEGKHPWYINFIFCSDAYLLELNKTYLARTTLTDVIAFSYSEEEGIVTGDIYISVDRVGENAEKFKQSTEKELYRVMIHGILHLIGYNDGSKKEKERMHKLEDKYLSRLPGLKG
jgi:probable rRNA maturation factor